jgi:hypothetical protein
MRTVAESGQLGKRERVSRTVAMWMEGQDIKFILLSVGLPALLVALVVQLVPRLLQF